MASALILYWQPGSGGDTVQRLLSLQAGLQSVVEHWQTTPTGRTIPCLYQFFRQQFDPGPQGWYSRDWNQHDIDRLRHYIDGCTHGRLIVPTHRVDQAKLLQQHLPNSITVGVCFDQCLWPWVITHWCHSFGTDDQDVASHFPGGLHQGLRERNLFGVYLLQQQLRFGSKIVTSAPGWDYNIELGRLLINDLSDIRELLPDLAPAQDLLASWSQKHSDLYRWQWPANPQLIKALGHNAQAPVRDDLDHALTPYERVLVNHWCDQHNIQRPAVAETTLHALHDFFENA